MTFPLMTIMDAYIRKFDKKFPGITFNQNNIRFERIGTINGMIVSIPVLPAGGMLIDGKDRDNYMLYGNYIVK